MKVFSNPEDPDYWRGQVGERRIASAPSILPKSQIEAMVIARRGNGSPEHYRFLKRDWVTIPVAGRLDEHGNPPVKRFYAEEAPGRNPVPAQAKSRSPGISRRRERRKRGARQQAKEQTKALAAKIGERCIDRQLRTLNDGEAA